ncbi:MAG: hypothetical protein A2504_02485 [Bdellovibrionales bacterium RIFOXYD12_FULL_39_22]|nr:MAG: hypothetical protein A2385_12515 [Bdellovibrionales bacterium RIFOXYB1_FULL_39_21]OFZ41172.1 MAG: hypothetical protein A2485_00925 [Bdellovibrionales bacterium RIFOXYC12_FULL_39_17]OFZ44926.1 MAG: hypothetical protein A2404_11670 [Bdellovibrionales bacterium RIFOXYC1_FULL_39_130]OFZ74373.1 MAG: hypothetical protein A2560_12040 [Bdellovibrionales bacterium RIFOXYD1_FULL_39_84]OFZ92375.1 MAG: hypothetical protein A2504_02485 [Bdellovibrionales bacterium RIFOXYD12_FULL_39_22]HLE10702.1 HD
MSEYVQYALLDIYPDEELPGDVYLFVNNHHLKYKPRNDVISKAKYEEFVKRQVTFVYILKSEESLFAKWSEGLKQTKKQEIISRIGPENSDLADAYFSTRSTLMEFVTKEVSNQTVKAILDRTRNVISVIQSKKTADKLIGKMFLYGQGLADHGMNVASLSTYLAINIGYEQHALLETIYTGGLLHDFGKTRIDKRYLEDINSPEYETAMKKHPTLGKTSLIVDNGLSDEVLRIVVEHHENVDGTGHPRGLNGSRIYELTKIVSIANAFDNLVQKDDGPISIAEKQKKAIKRLELEVKSGKIFDTRILSKSLKALDLIL